MQRSIQRSEVEREKGGDREEPKECSDFISRRESCLLQSNNLKSFLIKITTESYGSLIVSATCNFIIAAMRIRVLLYAGGTKRGGG